MQKINFDVQYSGLWFVEMCLNLRRIIQSIFSLYQYNVWQFLFCSVQAKVVPFHQKIIKTHLFLYGYAKGRRPISKGRGLFNVGAICRETVAHTIDSLYIPGASWIRLNLFPQFMYGAVYRLGVLHSPGVLTDLFGGQYDIGIPHEVEQQRKFPMAQIYRLTTYCYLLPRWVDKYIA